MKTQKVEKTVGTKVKSQAKHTVKRNTLVDMKVRKDIRGGVRPTSACN